MADAETVRAFVAVGSNIDPEVNIVRALDLLMERVRVTATSKFYRTAPIGRPQQAEYANGVWSIETDVGPHGLKNGMLRPIEARLGRGRSSDKYAPRQIDLDVVLYNDAVIDGPDLVLPDPDIRRRAFLVVPLLELAPEMVLPDTRESLASLAAARKPHGMEALEELTQRMRRMIDEH